jgi:hypothetical protein
MGIVLDRGGGDLAATEGFLTTDEQDRLGEVALAGAGVAGDDYSLLASGKIERGPFHDLPFIDAFLKGKIKIRERFPHRFEPVADRLNPVNRGAVQGEPRSCRPSFMTDDNAPPAPPPLGGMMSEEMNSV